MKCPTTTRTSWEYVQTARTEYVYDGRGRLRVRKDYSWNGSSWSLSSETRYVYDGMRVIQERNGSDTPTVSYTRGTDLSGSLEGAGGIGGLLARSHGYSSGNWSTHNFYHADGNGNITYLVNSSQALVASYRYDPFGNTISQSGTLASANVYRFSSKEIHVSTGIYYYGYRWYLPNLQRWLNRDPIGEEGGINLYGFVLNAPLMFYDPWGWQWYEPLDLPTSFSPRDVMKSLLGPGQLCTSKDCDQGKCGDDQGQHLPENYEVDQDAGRNPWRELPPPGECANSDLIATPKGEVKIPNGVTCTIECDDKGNPTKLVCRKRSIFAPKPTPNPGPEHRFPPSPYERQ